MSSFTEKMTEKEWEAFCEIMLRHHYGQPYFWSVPDEDKGDYGIEFYTAEGTIFQCYYPDLDVDMATYKRKMQNKINEDLKKLKQYEKEIGNMLDGVMIKQWVLLTQKNKSKDLIGYCNRKKKETLAKAIPFIDTSGFNVKIETAESFPSAKLYAQNVYLKTIDIPLAEVSDIDKAAWEGSNSVFFDNVKRKSKAIVAGDSKNFQDRVVTKYIQINKFLDQLKDNHPDLYDQIEDSARAQLESMQDESILEENIDAQFVKRIVSNNKEAFERYAKFFSERNKQSLSFGYLSKWISECYMDFINE
ncbi:hypothetical protein [Halomonas sp. DWK9]|uniref:hypothetical protein n=1 Tax=Halomonas sp. DWK9 TaxID=3060155 RepID=UPI00287F5185|nr:hypothetical protein [Halomonas sp. DWK9]